MEREPIRINNIPVAITGKWIRLATVQDQEWLEGQVVDDPEGLVAGLKQQRVKADIFSFVQKLPHTTPLYRYSLEWDNVAAIPIVSYKDWWENRLPQVTRKSVRRAEKRGVTVRATEFNDTLVQGIIGIHNDTPTRQGRPFAHYGKDFEVVKKEYGTLLDSSEFIGAYFGSELIGILKLIWMGNIAGILEILSKTEHYDKRPTNVLIAKAVEICERRGIAFLVYGKYIYGKKTNSSLTEFKRRNGFERIDVPRYYISLNAKGSLIIKLRLHRGLIGILPAGLLSRLRNWRAKYYQIKLKVFQPAQKVPEAGSKGSLSDLSGQPD